MNSIKAFGETKIQTGDNSLPGLSATSTAGEESKCVKKRAKRDRFGARFNRIALSVRGRRRGKGQVSFIGGGFNFLRNSVVARHLAGKVSGELIGT